MFRKETREKLKYLYDQVGKYIERDIVVECETCGCLVYKATAVKGKSEVRTKKEPDIGPDGWSCMKDVEYIYHPYYCKRCSKNVKAVHVD